MSANKDEIHQHFENMPSLHGEEEKSELPINVEEISDHAMDDGDTEWSDRLIDLLTSSQLMGQLEALLQVAQLAKVRKNVVAEFKTSEWSIQTPEARKSGQDGSTTSVRLSSISMSKFVQTTQMLAVVEPSPSPTTSEKQLRLERSAVTITSNSFCSDSVIKLTETAKMENPHSNELNYNEEPDWLNSDVLPPFCGATEADISLDRLRILMFYQNKQKQLEQKNKMARKESSRESYSTSRFEAENDKPQYETEGDYSEDSLEPVKEQNYISMPAEEIRQ